MSRFVVECSRSDSIARGYISNALGIRIAEPFCGYAMFNSEGKIVGAFAFNNYTGINAALTIACEIPVGIRASRFIADVAFNDLGCDRLSATTKATNERALKALRQVGFVQEGVLREFFGEDDGIIFGLLRHEQKLVKAAR